MPMMEEDAPLSDFYFIDREEPERAAATLLQMVRDRIPSKFQVHPILDIQVLCPMNRGSLGVREMNLTLQNALNPLRHGDVVAEKFGWQFRARDKVIQTENNYDKEVFNGDIGQIISIDPIEKEIKVQFEQRKVIYDFGELGRTIPGLRNNDSQIPGIRISCCRHACGYPAIHAPAAQSGLYRGDSGEKTRCDCRSEKSAWNGSE